MQKKIFLLLFSCLVSVVTFAQEDFAPAETVYNGFGKGVDDWYVDLQLGGNILFNDSIKEVVAGNGVRLNTSVTVGKWIMPYFGFRLQLKSMWWKGAISGERANNWGFDFSLIGSSDAPLTPRVMSDGSLEYEAFYINPHLDFTLSLLSCIKGGWADSQKWDIIPFIGLGYLQVFDVKSHGTTGGGCLTGNAGLIGKYRLTENWDINLELSTAFVPDYHRQVAGPVTQADLAFTIGATYNIGGHKFGIREKKERMNIKKDTVYVYNNTETVIERAAPISNSNLSEAAKKGTFDQPFQIGLIEFAIRSDKPKQDYEAQYYNVAAFISAYPEATLRLDAYCDAGTGSVEYNDELAKRRAESVRDILVNDYGVDESKITINPLGAREQVYEKTSLNRIVRITVLPK